MNEMSGQARNLVAAITANWLALKGNKETGEEIDIKSELKSIMSDENISSSLGEYIGFKKLS